MTAPIPPAISTNPEPLQPEEQQALVDLELPHELLEQLRITASATGETLEALIPQLLIAALESQSTSHPADAG
jgi:plasmid stability protein